FASVFGAAEEARLAGLLHDLGKYSEVFSLRLAGKESGLDHWSAGAWAALTRYQQAGTAIALAIQGHHIGLQNPDALRPLGNPARFAESHPLNLRLTDAHFPALLGRLAGDGLTLPEATSSLFNLKDPARGAGMLDVRMLFSALVDADFLATEAHFQRVEGREILREDGPPLRPAEALAHLENDLARLAANSPAAAEVNRLRSDLLQACLDAALLPPGLFTLTAPTGAGKTLAMLAFALRHAREHGLRRVVVAVPFLSIIEQTVRVYRDLLAPVFGPRYVLEHHSLAGIRGQEEKGDGQIAADRAARLQAENWDAPLIVTTSVQLLESLFANRPAACRKLHRLAGSVILLDEVQTLPPALAAATLATLSRLAERYGASVVFATATQPAFESLDARVRPLAASGWTPREIVPASLELFERARRTRVRWEVETPRSWDSLAAELAEAGSALCIVNLKKHALALATLLRDRGVPGLLHLSTNLCPDHRERVLAEVRRRLDDKLPCLLISTQCVEAGVDVDFPVVFRALGPLDAIAQAAGRCNRNGRMPEPGIVHVFVPEDEGYPPGGYEQAAKTTRMLLNQRKPEGMDLQSQELFDLYYRTLYSLTGVADGDQGRKAKELGEAIGTLSFQAAAEAYRLIDKDAVNVVVPYDRGLFEDLRRELGRNGRPTTSWMRRARSQTVNLYRPELFQGFLHPASPPGSEGKRADWFLLTDEALYDRELLGLTAAPDVWIA
ncbi:MAG TPA: CRISPR-associated helicase Cas3', partial [Thermoanaerobaculia bacterium]|nr:CRISPR-associated helicase Cas3' [Thermoanaerobaculia bacterium]